MKRLLSIILALFIGAAAYSQSADFITDLLESQTVNYGQAAYLSACHQGILPDSVSPQQAFEALKEINQIGTSVEIDDLLPMDQAAALFSCMWTIKGGLFYRISNASPRYAFKQFKADGVIPDYADPKQKLSGVQLLNLYTKCLSVYDSLNLDVSEGEAE